MLSGLNLSKILLVTTQLLPDFWPPCQRAQWLSRGPLLQPVPAAAAAVWEQAAAGPDSLAALKTQLLKAVPGLEARVLRK